MYKWLACLLLTGLGLGAQTSPAVGRLSPALSKALVSAGTPNDSIGQTLVGTMMSISLPDHQPSRQQLVGLADALRGVLVKRGISEAQVSVLSECIVDALSGAKASNFALASQLRNELATLRVDDQKADLIIRRFMAVGEAVRGPDDVPVTKEIELVMPPKAK